MIPNRSSTSGRGVLAAVFSLLGLSSLGAEVPTKTTSPPYDCGTLALYKLLAVEGRLTPLARIESRLPPVPPAGYSMRELRDAARACGLDLIGVRLSKSDRQPESPMLVFLNHEGHGHFAVIRPLGHTGRLVQVLDSNQEPQILDAATLYASPEWTGLALVRQRPDWLFRGGMVLGLGTVGLSLSRRIWRRLVRGRVAVEKIPRITTTE